MMELKDFIEQSVSDIIEAIKELKQRYNISPQMSGLESCEDNPIAPVYDRLNNKQEKRAIEFDVAVTTSENSSIKTEGKVGIKVIGGSIDGEHQAMLENTSHIKFSIPFYPEYIRKK